MNNIETAIAQSLTKMNHEDAMEVYSSPALMDKLAALVPPILLQHEAAMIVRGLQTQLESCRNYADHGVLQEEIGIWEVFCARLDRLLEKFHNLEGYEIPPFAVEIAIVTCLTRDRLKRAASGDDQRNADPNFEYLCGLFGPGALPQSSVLRQAGSDPIDMGDKRVCQKSQHQWDDYTHAVQQCAVCGTFRCNPIGFEWTDADDSEAEYDEMVEFYDPCEPYFTGAAELPPMPPEEEETSSDLSDVEQILYRLDQKARFAFYNGYGVMQLIFTDGSSVSRTDQAPSPMEEVQALLQAGERPLGFISPLRDRFGSAFIQTWDSGDELAEASLRASAHLRYGHRMGIAEARVSS